MVYKGHKKVAWRALHARLEILNSILTEIGYDEKKWDWQPVFFQLVMPSVLHAHPDVRLMAMQIVTTFYSILG